MTFVFLQEKKNFKKFTKAVSHKVDKVGEKAKKNLSKVNLHIGDGSSGKKDNSLHEDEERDRVSMPSPLPNKFSIRELDKDRTTTR